MKLFFELGYRFFRMPWEMGPRKELVELVEIGRIAPCRAIDLGCGTGANAIFLAKHGFEVTGVDFAASAIEKSKRKAEAAKAKVQFVVDDLTNLRKVRGTYDFLVDYGALHSLQPKSRDLYLRSVLPLTHLGSHLLLWCFERPTNRRGRFLFTIGLGPGEVERRFGEYFDIEKMAGESKLSHWWRGWAAYLMTRKGLEAK